MYNLDFKKNSYRSVQWEKLSIAKQYALSVLKYTVLKQLHLPVF